MLRRRRAGRAFVDTAPRPGAAAAGPRAWRQDPARLRQRRLLRAGVPRHRRRARRLDHLEERTARDSGGSAAPVLHRERRRQASRGAAPGGRDSDNQGLRPGPADHLFEDGNPVLQVLTSDTTAGAAALLAWLRCRWREENLFKDLEAHYGIHWLCDYHAELEDDGHLIGNGERKAGLREAPPSRGGARHRRAGARHAAHQRGAFGGREERGHRARRGRDHQGQGRRHRGHRRAQRRRRQARRQPDHRRHAESHPAHAPPQLADGPAAARRRRRALARQPAQRLPARQQRRPGHHPQPAPPRRHHHLHAPHDHRDPRPPGRAPDRPRPRPAPRPDQRRASICTPSLPPARRLSSNMSATATSRPIRPFQRATTPSRCGTAVPRRQPRRRCPPASR